MDDGKSTLIGRLLHDTKLIFEDQLAALVRESKQHGTTEGDIDFALLLDGLEAEREQGITIDVAYRFFATPRRAFWSPIRRVTSSSPETWQPVLRTPNSQSSSSTRAKAYWFRPGVTPSYAHSLELRMPSSRSTRSISSTIDRDTYERIVDDYTSFAAELGFSSIVPIPLSARFGDNVISRSERTAWYQGPSLLEYLETVNVQDEAVPLPFRFPVQLVIRPNQDFRGYAGTIASGKVRKGDPIVVANSGRSSRIKEIVTFDGSMEAAAKGDAITLVLSDELDISEVKYLLHQQRGRRSRSNLRLTSFGWTKGRLFQGRSYFFASGQKPFQRASPQLNIRLTSTRGSISRRRILALNDIGFCNVSCATPVAFDPYVENRKTGSFIIIDRFTNRTAGAGMIAFGLRRGTNIHHQPLLVGKAARAALKHQKPAIVWFTGLSGAGKSTIANIVEQRLNMDGHHTMMLDGDNVRHGLNRDLGFTEADRVENIRRVGEVAKLMVESGLIVLCSFISPYRAEREMVRRLVEDGEFIEVFVNTPIDDCMRRDPKGLYAKAKAGKLKNFTGVDAPYEAPDNPEIHLLTRDQSAQELAAIVLQALKDRSIV